MHGEAYYRFMAARARRAAERSIQLAQEYDEIADDLRDGAANIPN
jgi:hypothetical protein